MQQRSSRFWKGAVEAVRLGTLIVAAVIWRVPDAVPEAIGMWGGAILVIYGGGAWVNGRERDPGFQEALARREAMARGEPLDDPPLEGELGHPSQPLPRPPRLPAAPGVRVDDSRADDERL